MNLQSLESLRSDVETRYLSLLLDRWELDIRPRARVYLNYPRRIEVRCYHTRSDFRVPLGMPLVFELDEARRMGSDELEKMLDHLQIIINLGKLL